MEIQVKTVVLRETKMTCKGRIVLGALVVFAALCLAFDQLQAQLQPASSQTDFYFAHITDGGTDSERWTTQFRFVNPHSFQATGTLRFFTQNGGPLTVDFGTGSGDFFREDIPARGSVCFETKGTSPDLNVGFVQAIFDSPIQATAEFRVWRNDVFSNGTSVDGIVPNTRFWTFADAFTGIAVANPNQSFVSCTGIFLDSHGNIIRQTTISLPAFNHQAFNLGSFLTLPQNIEGSYIITCPEPVVSLAIAGNNKGITSSLPSGAYALPQNHEANIRRIFKHLVKTLNSTPDGKYAVGQPELLIGRGLILNAVAEQDRNRVTIWLALAELLADSPSELAYVIAHELGHIYQASHGQIFEPNNYELDADVFALFAAFFADYDAFAAAGALGKLAMVTKNASINAQRFDDLNDPHTSFTNRMIQLYGVIERVCSFPDNDSFCSRTREIFHPHMPPPLRNPEEEGQQ